MGRMQASMGTPIPRTPTIPFGRDTHESEFIRILYVLHLYLLSYVVLLYVLHLYLLSVIILLYVLHLDILEHGGGFVL